MVGKTFPVGDFHLLFFASELAHSGSVTLLRVEQCRHRNIDAQEQGRIFASTSRSQQLAQENPQLSRWLDQARTVRGRIVLTDPATVASNAC